MSQKARVAAVLMALALVGCVQPKGDLDRADGGATAIDAASDAQSRDAAITDTLDAGASDAPAGDASDSGTGRGLDATLDSGPGDAAPSDVGPVDGGRSPLHSIISVSGGGGRAGSSSYRLRIVVGAPTPQGRGQSASYRLLLGTGHAQHAH